MSRAFVAAPPLPIPSPAVHRLAFARSDEGGGEKNGQRIGNLFEVDCIGVAVRVQFFGGDVREEYVEVWKRE